MHERLRLYDIFRGVSLQSCQHEYIRVHGSMHGGGNSVHGSMHGGGNSVHGSDVHNVRDSIRRPLLVACRLWDLKQRVTLMLQFLHSEIQLCLNSLLYNMKSQIKVFTNQYHASTSIGIYCIDRLAIIQTKCRIIPPLCS
jgi:hypothetical protein